MTMRKMILAASVAALCLSVATANAAGFQLKEQSSSLQGAAFAGASAKADDLSTMFFNPAGMTRLENGTQGSVVASYVLPSAKFSTTSATDSLGGALTAGRGEGGDAGVGAVVPSFYAMVDLGLGDQWRTGVAVNTPFGLSTKYDNGWVGRYAALESELMTINVAPTVAYKINDRLSIGGNVQAQYADAKLTNAFFDGVGDGRTTLKGDDIAFGWGIGALWEATDDTRVGVNYRSRVVQKLDGNIRTVSSTGAVVPAGTTAATAGLTTPDVLSAGLVHELNDKWSLMGEVAWTNWSLFDDLTVVSDSGTTLQSVDESWDDTWFFAVGAEYKHSDAWTFRGGLAYDQSAVDTDHRTFRIPETDRIWTSLGASYNINPATSIDMNYTYIHAMDSRIDENFATAGGAVTGNVQGEFDANVNIATVGVNFKF